MSTVQGLVSVFIIRCTNILFYIANVLFVWKFNQSAYPAEHFAIPLQIRPLLLSWKLTCWGVIIIGIPLYSDLFLPVRDDDMQTIGYTKYDYSIATLSQGSTKTPITLCQTQKQLNYQSNDGRNCYQHLPGGKAVLRKFRQVPLIWFFSTTHVLKSPEFIW